MLASRIAIAATLLAGCGRLGFLETDAPPDACTLGLDAGAPRINLNTHRTVTVSGGTAVDFAVSGSPGATFTAPGELQVFDVPGTLTLRVTDAAGCTAEASLEVGGDVMFYAGGYVNNSMPTNQVLRSTDGVSWSVAGTLPAARMYGALVTFRDRLWWISGNDGVGARPEIFVSDDGATWTQAGAVPVGAYNFGFTVFQDALWLVGGNNNLGDVYRSTDAVTWTKVGSLPMSNHGGSLGVLGNQMIYAGGHNGSLFNWVLTSPDGATWTQVGTLPNPREYSGHVTIDGRFYVFGGQDTVPTPMTFVSSTTDGTTWTTEPPLPVGRAFGPVLRTPTTLWSLGGTDGGGVFRGTPGGAWSTVPSTFLFPRNGGGAALFTPPQ